MLLCWLQWLPLLDPLACAKEGMSRTANSNASATPATDFMDTAHPGRLQYHTPRVRGVAHYKSGGGAPVTARGYDP